MRSVRPPRRATRGSPWAERCPMDGRCATPNVVRHHGAVSGPRVIVVGAGVYGLAAARRLALAGADVTVLEAREAGGPFAASAGSSRVLRFEYGPDAHYTELVLRAREQWRELERLLGETLYEETGVLWFAVEESRYLHDSRADEPGRRAAGAPARARRGRAALPGVLGRGHRRRAARRGGRRAARAPRDARPGAPGARRGSDLREGVAVRARRRRRRRARRRQQRARRPGARDHGRLDARAACRPRRSARPSRSTPTCACATAGLPVWIYDLDVYGLGDDGGAGLKVGGHAIGADVDPDDPAAREAPAAEVRGSPTRRAGAYRACPGPPARRPCAAPTCAATR